MRAIVDETRSDREWCADAEGVEPGVLAERARWLVEICKQEGYRFSRACTSTCGVTAAVNEGKWGDSHSFTNSFPKRIVKELAVTPFVPRVADVDW